MKRPAIFFDRDNTLIISDGYLSDPSQVKLVEGAADAIARARAMGFATVVVSNQSGVARGLFGEEDVQAVNARLDELLRAAHPEAIIECHEFCPFHPEATIEKYRCESDRRKPRPGMILTAADKLDLDLSLSWVIGDAPRDIESGFAARCRTILLRNPNLSPSPTAAAKSFIAPDFVVSTLKEAMDVIEQATGVEMSDDVDDVPPAPAPVPPLSPRTPPVVPSRLENLAEQILSELRRHENLHADFSVPKLLAGIVQVMALAVLFLCYLNRNEPNLQSMLTFALVLQALTISLLLMGRQR